MKNTSDSTNQRAQIITRETKLPQILKNIAKLEGRVGGDNKCPETKGTKKYAQSKTSKKSPKKCQVGGVSWRGQ
jgi:hypothetical protein